MVVHRPDVAHGELTCGPGASAQSAPSMTTAVITAGVPGLPFPSLLKLMHSAFRPGARADRWEGIKGESQAAHVSGEETGCLHCVHNGKESHTACVAQAVGEGTWFAFTVHVARGRRHLLALCTQQGNMGNGLFTLRKQQSERQKPSCLCGLYAELDSGMGKPGGHPGPKKEKKNCNGKKKF